MKKLISWILVAMLVASGMVFPAEAVTGGVTASDISAVAGQTANVYISVEGYDDVESLAISFPTTPDGLTLEEAAWLLDGGSMTDVDMDQKKAVWACASTANLSESTQVFRLTYLVGALTENQDLSKQIPVTVIVDTQSGGQSTHAVTATLTLSSPAAYVTLNKSELALDLNGTKTEKLEGSVTPAGSTDTLSWESDNEAVATVDENGLVTALKAGVAMITAKAGDASAVCRVEVSCSHSGGTATCLTKAACTVCGNAYGNVNVENHTGEPKYVQFSDGHSKVYSCCSAVIEAKEEHKWENNSCTVCGASCQHSGGTATCEAPAVCDLCGQNYGVKNPENHTQEAKWSHDAQKHSKSYPCCGAVEVEEEEHSWSGGSCGICGYGCSHTGGTATCRKRAVCQLCGVSYGTFDNTKHGGYIIWSLTASTHGMAYSCCGSVVMAPQAHEMEGGACKTCGYSCDHSGSTIVLNAAQATCSNSGYTGDTHCGSCGTLIAAGSVIPATQNHASTGEWNSDEQNHWKICDADGCGATVEKAEHKFQWVVDAEPTETAAGKKHEQCEICQYAKETVEIPVQTHTHENITFHEAVEADCMNAGNVAYWTCGSALCEGKFYGDEKCLTLLETVVVPVNAENHVKLEQASDASGHYQTCQCGYKSEVTAHTASVVGAVEATREQEGYTGDTVCADCGYEMAKGQVIPVKQETLLDEVTNAQPGATVQISQKKEDGTVDTQINAEILEAAKGKDVYLKLDMGDYLWIIAGTQIQDADVQNVDLEVQLHSQNIPENAVEDLADAQSTMQFAVAGEGALGFSAELTILVGKEYAGVDCKLYRYAAPMARTLGASGNVLELVGSYTVDAEGKLSAQLSHGGDYLVVMDVEDLNPPQTGTMDLTWLLWAMGVAMAAAVVYSKKKLFD